MADSLDHELLQSLLTCAICEEIYAKLTSLKLLPCAHIFCIKCLDELVKGSRDKRKGSFECPLCRRAHKLPSISVEDEWPHPHCLSTLFNEPEEITCSNCDNGSVQWICKTCEKNFCDVCQLLHASVNRKHINSKRQTFANSAKEKAMKCCQEHLLKPVEIYCKDCSEMSCALCAVSGRHKGHSCDDIEEAAKILRVNMQKTHIMLLDATEKINSKLHKIKESGAIRDREIEHYMNEVKERANAIRELVSQHEQELLHQLKEEQTRNRNNQDTDVSHFETQLKEISAYLHSQTEADAILVEFFTKNELLTDDKVKQITNIQLEDASTQLTCMFNENIAQVKELFGKIDSRCPLTENSGDGTQSVKALKKPTTTNLLKNPTMTESDVEHINSNNDFGQKLRYKLVTTFISACESILGIAYYRPNEFVIAKKSGMNHFIDQHYFFSNMFSTFLSNCRFDDVCCFGGELLILDSHTRRIVFCVQDACYVNIVTKVIDLKMGTTEQPVGICCINNFIFITSPTTGTVYRLDVQNGRTLRCQENVFIVDSGKHPEYVATDGYTVAVSYPMNHKVEVFNWDGSSRFTYGNKGNGNKVGQLKWPHKVCFDNKGNIFIADRCNDRVLVLSPSGELLEQIQTKAPAFMMIDKFGNLFITGFNSNKIEVFSIYC